MEKDRMGLALNRWGIGNITIWQAGERMIGRDETEKMFPESAAFFKFLQAGDDE